MSRIAPHSGQFRLLVRPNGEIVAPDLVAPLVPVVRRVGESEASFLTDRIACVVEEPRLAAAKRPATDYAVGALCSLSTGELWRIHNSALEQSGTREPHQGASLLDVKVELGHRMLRSCDLCGHACNVNRTGGESGFCELGYGLCIAAYSMLYNEGPFVGQPTFGMFLKGCSLRCNFCYRPEDLRAFDDAPTSTALVASILDSAAEAGAESWHFLGGNPDQSLVAVLDVLCQVRHVIPVVWNSALYLSRSGLELLRGVVDVWVPDLKFGNDQCSHVLAGVADYSSTVRENLLLLRDEAFVVVRHMRYPGHDDCCRVVVEHWVRDNLPRARLHFHDHIPVTSGRPLVPHRG